MLASSKPVFPTRLGTIVQPAFILSQASEATAGAGSKVHKFGSSFIQK